MPNRAVWVVVFCALVGGVAFLAGLALRPEPVFGQMGAVRGGDLLAAVSQDNTRYPTLFVVDTKARNLAVYRIEPSAKNVRLLTARNIDWDLQIPQEYPPRRSSGSVREPSVRMIRDAVLKALKDGGAGQ